MPSLSANAALTQRTRRLLPIAIRTGVAALVVAVFAIACERAPVEPPIEPSTVAIGSVPDDVEYVDGRGSPRRLSDAAHGRPLVVVFTTVGCPLAARYLPVLADLEREYRERGVAFLALDVGAATPVEAAAQAFDARADFPFGKDLDGEVAAALGATRSPEVVLLDASGALRYRGRVDDRFRFSGARPAPRREDLRLALEAVLAGRRVEIERTAVDGCPLEPHRVEGDPMRNWNDHVAAIIERRCTPCHHAGGGAPFPLAELSDVRRRRNIVEEVVATGRMPPWFAAPAGDAHGQFTNDISLTKEERDTLLAWLRGGLSEGVPRAPLAAPSGGWSIGEPHLVLQTDPVDIPASGFVGYHYASLRHHFMRETWVEAIELIPDEPRLVHHALVAAVDASRRDDDMENLVSWGRPVFVYAPGRPKLDLGPGTAMRIPSGSALLMQVHYVTDGRARPDRIQVGLRFPDQPIERQLRAIVIQDPSMRVPPRHPAFPVVSEVMADRTAPARLHSVFAHMHLRGRDVELTARRPDGVVETLLRVPAYHFDWQAAYEFRPDRPPLPEGTVLTYTSRYDNSEYNELNPDPDREVPFGEDTIDEMHYAWILYTLEGEDLGVRVDPRSGHRLGPPPLGQPAGFEWPNRRANRR